VESQTQPGTSNTTYTLVWDIYDESWNHTPYGSGTSWSQVWVNPCGINTGAEYSAHWLPQAGSATREVTRWVEGPNPYYTNYTDTIGPWENYIGWVPWRKCHRETRSTNTHQASEITYVSTDTLNEEARIELWTGGDPAVTNNDNIILVTVRAQDDDTSTPIPVSELTMEKGSVLNIVTFLSWCP
jgi:hypothetical protein